MWDIVFYKKSNGRCPIHDFLCEQSPADDLPYIMNALDQLKEHGYDLRRPLVEHLGDGIYELRVRVVKKRFRILYFFFDSGKIILTNGLKKKTGPVPVTRIITAKEYRKDFIDRNTNGRKT